VQTKHFIAFWFSNLPESNALPVLLTSLSDSKTVSSLFAKFWTFGVPEDAVVVVVIST
jgi:hypothetical protein